MSDYLFLMESRLSPEQSRIIGRLQMAAGALGMTLYIAGGAIRDLICGYPIDDLDFVAEGKALQLVRALARDEDFRIVWQSESLQAAELEFPSGAQASVAMARSEIYANGSLRTSPAPIILDLKRRDFSINSIGISLNPQSRGLLLDPTNGAGDMERKEIRTLHSRSFSDDPSRMFRAVRLRHRLHFTLEEKTASQYQGAKGARLEELASGAALLHELRQIARDQDPVEILKVLEKEKLLLALNPRLHGNHLNLHGIAQATKAAHTLMAAGLRPPSFDLFLSLLRSKLGARDRALLGKRLEMKKPELAALDKLELSANRLAKEITAREGSSPTRLYNTLLAAPPDLLVLLLIEHPNAKLQARLKAFLHKYIPLRRELPSRELAELGIPAASPQHQKILDAFFFELIEGKLHGKTDHAKFLRKLAGVKEETKAQKKARLEAEAAAAKAAAAATAAAMHKAAPKPAAQPMPAKIAPPAARPTAAVPPQPARKIEPPKNVVPAAKAAPAAKAKPMAAASPQPAKKTEPPKKAIPAAKAAPVARAKPTARPKAAQKAKPAQKAKSAKKPKPAPKPKTVKKLKPAKKTAPKKKPAPKKKSKPVAKAKAARKPKPAQKAKPAKKPPVKKPKAVHKPKAVKKLKAAKKAAPKRKAAAKPKAARKSKPLKKSKPAKSRKPAPSKRRKK